MAASVARTGNARYVAAGETGALVNSTGIRLAHIIVIPTAANAEAILKDSTTAITFFHSKVSGSGDAVHYPLEIVPIFCPNGITVNTVTNCDIILILHPGGQH